MTRKKEKKEKYVLIGTYSTYENGKLVTHENGSVLELTESEAKDPIFKNKIKKG